MNRKLKNGANIIAVDFDSRVLLAKYDGNNDEYVTWQFHIEHDEITCYWGHYYRIKSEAKADFLVRSANL